MTTSTGGTAEPGPDYASFVLRLTQERYRDEAGQPRLRWRGHIRHVQGEEEARFTDFADAVAFIQAQLAELTMEAASAAREPEREQLLEDGFQLWGRVAEQYADLWGEAMRRTMRQSEAYNRQMAEALERSLRAWHPLVPGAPAPPPERATGRDGDAVLEALEALRGELRDVARKVDALEARLASGER